MGNLFTISLNKSIRISPSRLSLTKNWEKSFANRSNFSWPLQVLSRQNQLLHSLYSHMNNFFDLTAYSNSRVRLFKEVKLFKFWLITCKSSSEIFGQPLFKKSRILLLCSLFTRNQCQGFANKSCFPELRQALSCQYPPFHNI